MGGGPMSLGQPVEEPKDLLSQRLPLELVEEIFLFCLPSRTYVAPSPYDAPLLLCQVCSSWRTVAISTPRLWRSINAYSLRSKVEIWLSRAGDCPLSVSFAIPALYPKTAPFLPPHIGHIIHRSSNWKNITLRMLSGASFRALKNVALPLLHTLRLDGYGCHIDGQEEFFSLLHSAPNLRKISWYSPIINPCSVNIPWGALTDFHSHCVLTTTEVVKILSDAPQLKRLVVAISDHLGVCSFPLRPLVHNHLREMELTHRQHLAVLFEYVTLPVLEILYIGHEVRFESRTSYWPHQHFLSFLRHCHLTLTSLHLDSPAITQENIVEYLQYTRSLVHLHLGNGVTGDFAIDEVVSVLTYRGIEDVPCFCPRLESIALAGNFQDEHVIAMIESRWRISPPSYSVHDDPETSMAVGQCGTDHDVTGTASSGTSVTRRSPSSREAPPSRLKSVEIEIHTHVQSHINQLISFQDEGLLIEFL